MMSLICVAVLLAQAAAPLSDAPAAVEASAPSQVLAPEGTELVIALAEEVTSRTAKAGDKFQIVLAEALRIDERVVLPAGVRGQGEVIHADRSGVGGRPGELILAARFLQHGNQRIPLRAFRLGGSGRGARGVSEVTGIAAALAVPGGEFVELFIRGGAMVAPAGARATAKLASDMHFTPPPPTAEPGS